MDTSSLPGGNLVVDRPELGRLFAAIEPQLTRFPAIDPATLRRRVTAIVEGDV